MKRINKQYDEVTRNIENNLILLFGYDIIRRVEDCVYWPIINIKNHKNIIIEDLKTR